MWGTKATVYNWISKVQGAVFIMISTCIWSLVQATPMMTSKEPLPSKSREQKNCLQGGCLQGRDEELGPGGEAYSLHPLLRETENGWIDVINPFEEILLFAVLFKCGGPDFSQIIMSTSFVDLYGEDIGRRNRRNEEDDRQKRKLSYCILENTASQRVLCQRME